MHTHLLAYVRTYRNKYAYIQYIYIWKHEGGEWETEPRRQTDSNGDREEQRQKNEDRDSEE